MDIARCPPFGILICLFAALALTGCATTGDKNYSENPGTEGDGNSTIGPDYKIDSDLTNLGNPTAKSLKERTRRSIRKGNRCEPNGKSLFMFRRSIRTAPPHRFSLFMMAPD